MAFDPYPTGYFPHINYTGVIGSETGVFIPYEDLESFDYTVATAQSGDVRQLIYSFVEAVADRYLTGVDTTDRPTQVTVTRSSTVPNDSTIRKVYGFTINVELADTLVIPE
jgi:phytoene/squalene synthetase